MAKTKSTIKKLTNPPTPNLRNLTPKVPDLTPKPPTQEQVTKKSVGTAVKATEHVAKKAAKKGKKLSKRALKSIRKKAALKGARTKLKKAQEAELKVLEPFLQSGMNVSASSLKALKVDPSTLKSTKAVATQMRKVKAASSTLGYYRTNRFTKMAVGSGVTLADKTTEEFAKKSAKKAVAGMKFALKPGHFFHADRVNFLTFVEEMEDFTGKELHVDLDPKSEEYKTSWWKSSEFDEKEIVNSLASALQSDNPYWKQRAQQWMYRFMRTDRSSEALRRQTVGVTQFDSWREALRRKDPRFKDISDESFAAMKKFMDSPQGRNFFKKAGYVDSDAWIEMLEHIDDVSLQKVLEDDDFKTVLEQGVVDENGNTVSPNDPGYETRKNLHTARLNAALIKGVAKLAVGKFVAKPF